MYLNRLIGNIKTLSWKRKYETDLRFTGPDFFKTLLVVRLFLNNELLFLDKKKGRDKVFHNFQNLVLVNGLVFSLFIKHRPPRLTRVVWTVR